MTEKSQSSASRLFKAAALLALSLMTLAGCGSTKPSRFYVLHSHSAGGTDKPLDALQNGAIIGVGPVKIPEYLDRKEIVTRTSSTQLDLAEYDRWAEPLNANVTRVLAENLSSFLGTERVETFPWPGSTKVDYQVLVDLSRFDGTSEGKVFLVAHWSIVGAAKRQALVTKKSSFVESTDHPGFEAMVSAQSRALGQLSREIASEISALEGSNL